MRKKITAVLCLLAMLALTACDGLSSSVGGSSDINTDSTGGSSSSSSSSNTTSSSTSSSSEEEFVNPGDNLGGGGTASDIPVPSNLQTVIDGYLGLFDLENSDVDTVVDTGDEYTTIVLSGTSGTINGSGAAIENGVLSITAVGTYVLSGDFSGHVYVNVDGNVHLILNGVNITSPDTAAIAIFGKKKKTVTIAKDTTNVLTDAKEYSVFYNTDNDEPNGCLFSKKALTINGEGTLTINANYNNGITCKDELRIISGTITVNAANNAIKGNDNLYIFGGAITAVSGNDAIKSDSEDSGMGNVYIDSAVINATSDGDGITAFGALYIKSGNITVLSGGGAAANTSSSSPNGRPDWGWGAGSTTTTDDDTSSKGIKSDSAVLIEGGVFSLDCNDDAIHSNGTVILTSGEFSIKTGDDGVHADEHLYIYGGEIDIVKSYEGLESAKVEIFGGNISVVSSDDGINAADGTNSAFGVANTNCQLIIGGGTLVINAEGDGVDSNGSLLISGGNMTIYGPTSGANGSLDSESGVMVTGGEFVAFGSLGMVETPAKNSTQNCVSYANSSAIAAGVELSVLDSSGSTIMSFTTKKTCQSIIFSSPKLVTGASYTLYNGDTKIATFTISSVVTSVGSSSGFGGGGSTGRPGASN